MLSRERQHQDRDPAVTFPFVFRSAVAASGWAPSCAFSLWVPGQNGSIVVGTQLCSFPLGSRSPLGFTSPLRAHRVAAGTVKCIILNEMNQN